MTGTARILGYLISLVALGAAVGCAPLQIQSNPDAFAVPLEGPLSFQGGRTVELANAYKVPTESKIYIGGPGWVGDLQQYTNTAITKLGRELQKAGVSLGAGRKSVVLRVRDVQAAPGMWLISSKLSLDAEYGDGTKSSIQVEDGGASAWRAVDGALVMAVGKLLVDDRFRAYVNAD